ncbi:hypothetical protein LIER_08282 [Lithospermum erythrorhizon]|uniref:DUF4283 domain-containing protein n=1 Tax=Lithospermum erythrorhizon TaxID=34254 RepID=A0AAV3PBF9_LITER
MVVHNITWGLVCWFETRIGRLEGCFDLRRLGLPLSIKRALQRFSAFWWCRRRFLNFQVLGFLRGGGARLFVITGKKSRKVKGKTTFSPLPTNDFFKDLKTPPVHDLNPIASAVFQELEKALPSASRVFEDSPLSTPRAGLGNLVEGDVRDGSAKGDDVPSVDCSTPVVDGGCCGGSKDSVGLARGKGKKDKGRKIGEEVTFGVEDVVPMKEPEGFCLTAYFFGRFLGLNAVHQLKDSWKVKCKVILHEKGWVVFRFDSDTDRFHFRSSSLFCLRGAGLSRALGRLTYGHNFFGYDLLNPPVVDVGVEPTVVPEDYQDAREDVCEDLVHQEVIEVPRIEERFMREGFSYSEAFFSNLDPVRESEDDTSHEAEDSEEELELDDEVGVSEEELERDEFIEAWEWDVWWHKEMGPALLWPLKLF